MAAIHFPQPCAENWNGMRTDGRTRFCDSCATPVHDLSQYTPEEAETLLVKAGGSACMRATITGDGRVVTRPSKIGRILTAAFAMPAMVASLAAAGAANAADLTDSATGAIAGQVHAATAVGVRVSAQAPGVLRMAVADAGGGYSFDHLPPGTYRLSFSAPGGAQWSLDQVVVAPNAVTVRDTADPKLDATAIGEVIVVAGRTEALTRRSGLVSEALTFDDNDSDD